MQVFDDLDLALFVYMFCLLALCALAFLLNFAREAYLGWRLLKLAGGHRRALVALEELEDRRVATGMRGAVDLNLVKR